MKLFKTFFIFLLAVAANTAYSVDINPKARINESSISCDSGLFCSDTVSCSDLTNLCPSSQLLFDCPELAQEPCPTTSRPSTCPEPTTCPPRTLCTCPWAKFTCLPCPTCTPPTTVQCTTPSQPTSCPTATPCTCPTLPPCTCTTPLPCKPCPGDPPPCSTNSPKFTQTFYQTSLASWPKEGQFLHLGLEATTPEDDLIIYEFISPPSFIILDNNRDIRFTTDVSEGAFVGPNNVLISKVVAYVYGQQDRRSTATTVIVFPRSVKED